MVSLLWLSVLLHVYVSKTLQESNPNAILYIIASQFVLVWCFTSCAVCTPTKLILTELYIYMMAQVAFLQGFTVMHTWGTHRVWEIVLYRSQKLKTKTSQITGGFLKHWFYFGKETSQFGTPKSTGSFGCGEFCKHPTQFYCEPKQIWPGKPELETGKGNSDNFGFLQFCVFPFLNSVRHISRLVHIFLQHISVHFS